MDNKSKRIGTFKQFLKEQQKIKKLNEAVNIECDFWDEAQVTIMDVLSQECQGFLSWDTLVKYVKNKFLILGREDPGFEEALLIQHIKDLVFQFYIGDSLYTSALCDWGENNSEIQAKGLVVSELAKVIFEKVNDTRKSPDDPVPGTISLIDKDKAMGQYDDDGFMDDLPFEGKKVRPVKTFKEYSKALNETVAMIDCESQDDCINYCLDRIQKEVGSLDANEIVNFAFQTAPTESKTELALDYVKALVYDYLTKQKGQVKLYGVGNQEKVKETVPEEALKKGMLILCGDIADEILGKIADLNGVSDGKAE